MPFMAIELAVNAVEFDAFGELLRMIEGGEPPVEPVTLPGTELIIRKTTGPMRQTRTQARARHAQLAITSTPPR
jgi:hypothetical protein